MIILRRLLSFLFRRRTNWDALPWKEPAAVEDEMARLNNER